jgi:hypothetical protein
MTQELLIRQLEQVREKIIQAQAATDALRDIRREKNADRGKAWRNGEQADIALGDVHYIIGGLLEALKSSPPFREKHCEREEI